MTDEQKKEIKASIAFYEARHWDWSSVVEYLIRRNNGTLPAQELAFYRAGLFGRWRERRKRSDDQ